MNDETFMTDKQVAERYSLHRVTIWKWVKLGKLPAPLKLEGMTRWRLSDLQKWEAQKAEAA